MERCLEEMCSNGGTCVVDPTNQSGYKCLCEPQFSGPTCLINLDSCVLNPCPRNHRCVNRGTTYECVCIDGVSCSPLTFASLVLSLSPHTKLSSQLIQSPCTTMPCLHNGTCIHTEPFKYECKCRFGYSGRNCERIESCLIKPDVCNFNGVCYMVQDKVSTANFKANKLMVLKDLFRVIPL